jgi:putative redox protein
MPSQRIFVPNATGDRLAVILEQPASTPKQFAMFSHCFTCTKDLKAIVKISRQLALRGIAVARFDFTGLGDSSGDFSETNFETNVSDVLTVAHWLGKNYESPRMLMGLSLGGAAMMVASSQLDTVGGVVTIAAPSCTRHLAEFLVKQSPEIETDGIGTVVIGGRYHTIMPQLLNSLRQRDLERDISAIRAQHLIMHSPQDQTLGFYHAENIFRMTGGSKTFVTLDGADHLLVNREGDIEFVANLIDLWSRRWLEKTT